MLSISDNIRQQLLTPNNLMQSEPRLLLQDFVREPDNYISLFNAIANNYRSQKEMKTFTRLAQGHLSRYLNVLESAGFITRRVPITAGPRSRQSRYHITDPYLRFYYRFLAARQSQLALAIQEPVLADISRRLIAFIGMHTWEEICREWVLRAGAAGKLAYLADQVGSYWDKTVQVDMVGLNRMEKTLILGECKWSSKEMDQDVLAKLVQKTDAVVPSSGTWRVLYVGMAQGGWTVAAQKFAKENVNVSGSNWQGTSVVLTDLDEIDDDFVLIRGGLGTPSFRCTQEKSHTKACKVR